MSDKGVKNISNCKIILEFFYHTENWSEEELCFVGFVAEGVGEGGDC
jgi:hypothetical protein